MNRYFKQMKKWWSGLRGLNLPSEKSKDFMQYFHEKKQPDNTVQELLTKVGDAFKWKE